MPHYILQLLLAVGTLPHGTIFVSIYESGSADASGMSTSLPYHFAHIAITGKRLTVQQTPLMCFCR